MSLYEDLRYLFMLTSVEQEPDGRFTLRATDRLGRTILHVPRERMLEIVAAKWGPDPKAAEEAAKAAHVAGGGEP